MNPSLMHFAILINSRRSIQNKFQQSKGYSYVKNQDDWQIRQKKRRKGKALQNLNRTDLDKSINFANF